MTPQQKRAYDFIAAKLANTGISPSFDEIRKHLGLKSRSGVHRLVEALTERGHIRRLPGLARALELGDGMPPQPAGVKDHNPLKVYATEALWAELDRRGALDG